VGDGGTGEGVEVGGRAVKVDVLAGGVGDGVAGAAVGAVQAAKRADGIMNRRNLREMEIMCRYG